MSPRRPALLIAIAIAITIGCTHTPPPARHVDVTPGTYRYQYEHDNGTSGFDSQQIQLALVADGTAHVTRTSESVYAAATETEHDVNDHASIEMTGTWTRDGDAVVVHVEVQHSSVPGVVAGWQLRCHATTGELVCDFPPPGRPLVLHRAS